VVLSYERGTPVAGASCFVLGVSIVVLHSTLLPTCLSSRHEPHVDLLEIGLYEIVHARKFPLEGAEFWHLKGPTFSTKSLLGIVELVELSCSTQLNKDSQNYGTCSTQLNSTRLE